jgi:hypothetical protein
MGDYAGLSTNAANQSQNCTLTTEKQYINLTKPPKPPSSRTTNHPGANHPGPAGRRPATHIPTSRSRHPPGECASELPECGGTDGGRRRRQSPAKYTVAG